MQPIPGTRESDMPDTSKEPIYEARPINHDTRERQYLTGLRLAIVLGSLTLVSFLVLLDMSILGTVGLSTRDEI